jgi:hypothetical protein
MYADSLPTIPVEERTSDIYQSLSGDWVIYLYDQKQGFTPVVLPFRERLAFSGWASQVATGEGGGDGLCAFTSAPLGGTAGACLHRISYAETLSAARLHAMAEQGRRAIAEVEALRESGRRFRWDGRASQLYEATRETLEQIERAFEAVRMLPSRGDARADEQGINRRPEWEQMSFRTSAVSRDI